MIVDDAINGTLTLAADGSFLYAPDPDFNGTDVFTYQASDGTERSNLATVTITVAPQNDEPVAENDGHTTTQDVSLGVSRDDGVLSNDGDVDGDPLVANLIADVANGTLVLNSDGSFTYTPDSGFSGTDSFTYQANDGTEDSNIAT